MLIFLGFNKLISIFPCQLHGVEIKSLEITSEKIIKECLNISLSNRGFEKG